MGNSSTKESRTSSVSGPATSRPGSSRHVSSPATTGRSASSSQTPADRPALSAYASRGGRGSRHDLSFLGIGGGSDRDPNQSEPRRETKAEREARKLEIERVEREKERQRSMREEGVDGGYLVTLGTYTGPEDFNKKIVRQMMIERRLAPFWKGLNDHSESWAEHQLVAVVRGLPLPAPDETSPDDPSRSASQTDSDARSSDLNVNHLTVPMSSRTPSYNSDHSASLSPSHPAFASPSSSSPFGSPPASSPLFRARAKTLATLTTLKNQAQADMTPPEIFLPKDPFVNGQRTEAFLYKDAEECPICFLYYPPYLNKTRCCDQAICSECFVQIKRPDPHPPEHHDPADPNAQGASQLSEEESMLVSEPAACPYCQQPEFGVTYDPPPLRRGLSYAHHGHPFSAASAMSSSSSLGSQGIATQNNHQRRRATSLAANAPSVITTDRVRPDWAKKLADARAHALRRSAAATALHNAAYVLGGAGESRVFGIGRRRRTMFGGDSPGSGNRTPSMSDGLTLNNLGALLAAAERRGSGSSRGIEGPGDLYPGRMSSRRNRVDDLEELMMMEAIRLSLAAEEERKRKEEKQAAKDAKKDEKKQAKEAKRAEKARKKSGGFPSGSATDTSAAVTPAASTPMASDGKGKGVDRSGYFASNRPGGSSPSPLNGSAPSSSKDDSYGATHLPVPSHPIDAPRFASPFPSLTDLPPHRSALRNLSTASSSASSLNDSPTGSLRNCSGNGFSASASSTDASPNTSGLNIAAAAGGGGGALAETPPGGGAGMEPMLNFRSLAAVVDAKDGSGGVQYVEDAGAVGARQGGKENGGPGGEGGRPAGPEGTARRTVPPVYLNGGNVEAPPPRRDGAAEKHRGSVSVVDASQRGRQAAQ